MKDLDNFAYYNSVHMALRKLADIYEKDPEMISHYRALDRETWDRVKYWKQTPEITFAQPVKGYWAIGYADAVYTYPEPQGGGLEAAWSILLHGESWKHLYRAETPGGLRNQLRRAADWIKSETGCIELANVINKISISQKDGSVLYIPRKPQIKFLADPRV